MPPKKTDTKPAPPPVKGKTTKTKQVDEAKLVEENKPKSKAKGKTTETIKDEPPKDKSTKGGKKKVENIEKKDDIKSVINDNTKTVLTNDDILVSNDDEFKKIKEELSVITMKIKNHQTLTQSLEKEREEIVTKISNYLLQKNGTLGENILETTTRLKKSITKVGVNVAQIDDDDDSSSDTTNNDDDDDDIVTQNKGKKFVSNNKKNKENTESESESDSESDSDKK